MSVFKAIKIYRLFLSSYIILNNSQHFSSFKRIRHQKRFDPTKKTEKKRDPLKKNEEQKIKHRKSLNRIDDRECACSLQHIAMALHAPKVHHYRYNKLSSYKSFYYFFHFLFFDLFLRQNIKTSFRIKI